MDKKRLKANESKDSERAEQINSSPESYAK